MTPLKIETIQDKLFRLDRNIEFIEDILKDSDEELLKGEIKTRYTALEHILQLSIQIVLDIGSHILAEEFHENPIDYKDVIIELGENGLVTKEFAAEQSEMAKFRNKIVHDYDNVDPTKVMEYARQAPQIFRVFGKAFRDFVMKKKLV